MRYTFDWTPEMSVGDEKIDKQHQKLLMQVNKIINIIISGAKKEDVKEAVEFFDKYIKEHLQYEEEYMKENNYPDIEKHLAQHKDFIDHYKIFRDKINADMNPEIILAEIERYIGNWWLEHIGIEDKKYSIFIANK